MKSLKTAVLYGVYLWIIAFVAAVLIFPIHDTHRAFFESIMPVVISIVTSFFAYKYIKKLDENFVKESFLFGVTITVVNWIIDAFVMLSPSPMQMTVSDYVQDIGFTYLMMIAICAGFGYVAKHFSQLEKT